MGSMTSHDGVNVAARKSQMQKAVRSGNVDAAVDAVTDLCLTALGFLATEGDSVARATGHASLWTNTCNRVRVMAMEDVGTGDVSLVPITACAVTVAQQAAARGDAGTALACLQAAVTLQCRAPKLRICSDLKAACGFPPWGTHGPEAGLGLAAKLRTAHGLPAAGVQGAPAAKYKALAEDVDGSVDLDVPWLTSEMVLHHMDNLAQRLAAAAMQSPRGWRKYWGSADGRKMLDAQFTALLRNAPLGALHISVIMTLQAWSKAMTHAERPLYLVLATLAALDPSLRGKQAPKTWAALTATQLSPRALQAYVTARVPMQPQGADLDKHTPAGRAAGKTAWDFAREGAVVANESPARVGVLRVLYHHTKLVGQFGPLFLPRTEAAKYMNLVTGELSGALPPRPQKGRRGSTARTKRVRASASASAGASAGAGGGAGARASAAAPKRARSASAPAAPSIYQQLPQELVAALATREGVVAGQRVTGRYKPPTWLMERVVVKGPYSTTAAAPGLVQYRTDRFRAWGAGAAHGAVLPCHVYHYDGGVYVTTPNAARMPARVTVQVVSRWLPAERQVAAVADREGNFAPQVAHVLKGSAGAAAGAGPHAIPRDQWLVALQHLALRVVLGCGDSGLHNMVWVLEGTMQGKVVGLDFEDWRGATKDPSSDAWPQDWFLLLMPRPMAAPVTAALRLHLLPLLPQLLQWAAAGMVAAKTTPVPPVAIEMARWARLVEVLQGAV